MKTLSTHSLIYMFGTGILSLLMKNKTSIFLCLLFCIISGLIYTITTIEMIKKKQIEK